MKQEAMNHMETYLKDFSHTYKSINLTKIKQSNKKPAYQTIIAFEDFSLGGVVFQNRDNEWCYHYEQEIGLTEQRQIHIDKMEDIVHVIRENQEKFAKAMAKLNRKPTKEDKQKAKIISEQRKLKNGI